MIDIIIIGGGTAGMTAGLYSIRSGKSVLILEGENIGGQIAYSPRVENYPSRREMSGAEFSEDLFSQITDLGVAFEFENVVKVEKKGEVFFVETEYNTYESKAVIIATGVKHRHFGFENENALIGKGISYCALCDGAFYEGEDVVLIGDANTALQYAILLSNYCKKVTVVTLFDKFFADRVLVDRVLAKENIEVFHNKELIEYVGENELEGLRFKDKDNNGEIFEIKTKGVFVAIGQVPNNEKFKNLVDLDPSGFIIASESCKTKTPGLFVAGDCRTKLVRQLTTAVNDGAISATNAVRFIDE